MRCKFKKFNFFIGMLSSLILSILLNCQAEAKKKCKEHELEASNVYGSGFCRQPRCPLPMDQFFNPEFFCKKQPGSTGTACVCKHGWVYDVGYDACIRREYCQAVDDYYTQYSNCDAACQKTCDCLKSDTCRCDGTCIAGYICLSGYIRNSTAGYCIPQSECPK